MNNVVQTAPAPSSSEGDLPHFSLDTRSGSLLHRLLPHPGRHVNALTLYVVAVALTWLPMALLALAAKVFGTEPATRLHFFNDWNVFATFLLSFPCIFVFALTDQSALASALKVVQSDGTVTLSEDDARDLRLKWERRFRTVNVASQAVGLVIAAIVAVANYEIYLPEHVGYWIGDGGKLRPVGVAYLYAVGLLYFTLAVYVFRNVAIAFLFQDIVRVASLRLLPMHPDHAGGLLPVGRLGLRNQYVLMLLGLNLVVLVIVTLVYLAPQPGLYSLIGVAIVAYLLLGPIVFVAPLLPFRQGMLKTKAVLMSEVAQRLRVELHRIRSQIVEGSITQSDEELVDRLKKIAGVIDELPVWPFDASTLRKFFASYILPAAGSVAYAVAQLFWGWFKDHFK